MMKTIIEKSLRELLKGVNDDVNPIFDVAWKEESITVETELDNSDLLKAKKEKAFSKKFKTLELNARGIKFINTIVDHADADKSDELTMLDIYKVNEYSYPNIGLTKLINLSRRAYFNRDKFEMSVGALLQYDEIKQKDFIYNVDDEIETLDPETFSNTWNQILKLSKIADGVNCGTKLTKPVLYWENLNIAMKGGKLMKKIGTTPSRDEQILAQLCAAEWNIDADQFLIGGIDQLSDEAVLDWLVGKTNSSNSNNKSYNSTNNPRRNKFQKGPKNYNPAVSHKSESSMENKTNQ